MARKPTLAVVDSRRTLPSVTKVLGVLSSLPHGLAVSVARAVVDDARSRVEAGEAVTEEAVLAEAARRAAGIGRSLLQPVVNATGVIVHTNLGRAPLGSDPLAAVAAVAGAYSNLEFRLDRGVRGSRQEHAGAILARACGAEAALVVNNNAAAVLLVLAALARGREVIVSRGELVEIGGGFRVPDVMAESGARLVEVGTTNRTRLADYQRALSAETALILRVHASNYRMVGFVECYRMCVV
jgi:L-seryl-tRNA(Ser) seleniumtransferase